MKNIKKYILIIILLLVGFCFGFLYTIKNQKIVAIVNNYEENYRIIAIEIFGQDFNYIFNVKGFKSVND